MSAILKRRLAIAAGVFAAVWISLALYFFQQPRFFSSPTASRETMAADRDAPYKTWREYDRAEISSDGNSRARVRFSLGKGSDKDELIVSEDYSISSSAMTGKASNIQKLPVVKAEKSRATLPEGELRLLAVGARWNTGEPEHDALPRDGEFLEPVALQPFDWAKSGVPPEWRDLPPALPNTVRLRFFLQASGDALHFYPGNVAVFDARSRFMVGASQDVEVKGRFAALDVAAALWHDTPIELVFDLPRGQPTRMSLPPQGNGSIWFQAPRAPVFNVLGTGKGRIRELPVDPHDPFFFGLGLKVLPGDGSYLLFYTPHTESGEFFQLQLPGGETHWFQATTFRHGQIQTSQPLDGATVAFYPERSRVWFGVSALPMMPNRRDRTRNLFEVKVPFVDTSEPNVASAMMVKAAQMELQFAGSSLGVAAVPKKRQPFYWNLSPDEYLKMLRPVHATMKKETTIVLGPPPDPPWQAVADWWENLW